LPTDTALLFLALAEWVYPPLGLALLDFLKVDPKLLNALTKVTSASTATLVAFLAAAALVLAKGLLATLPVAKSISEFVKNPQAVASQAGVGQVSRQLGRLVKQATPKGSRFVVFIDDLERCRPSRCVEILEATNQLLDHERVVIVLMADMPALAASVEIKYKELARRYEPSGPYERPAVRSGYGRAYLQKMVQLQFDLPSYSVGKVGELARYLAVLHGFETDIPAEKGGLSRVSFWLRRARFKQWPRWLQFVTEATGTALFVSGGAMLTGKLTGERTSGALLSAVILLSSFVVSYLVYVRRMAKIRRTIDDEIRSQVKRLGTDLSKVEEAVAARLAGLKLPKLPDTRPRLLVVVKPPSSEFSERGQLVRERVQHYLEEESEFQRQAEEEVIKYLQPLPRHAKRLLNRLRLLLFVAHERQVFGGTSELTPRHMGKWAVLCERWPELAQAISTHPDLMSELEGTPGSQKSGTDKYRQVLKKLAPAYVDDSALPGFCHSGVRLGPVMERIVRFERAPAPPRPP
jgi:hypothetical protein